MKRIMSIPGNGGFTLIELMLVVFIFSIVTGATYAFYFAQERSYARQEMIVEMNQDTRAFLYYIEKDIRMAGYNPTEKADAGIIIAEPARVEFTADIGTRRDNTVACSDNEGCDSIPDEEINQKPCVNCVTERMRYFFRPGPVVNLKQLPGEIYKVFNDSTDNNPELLMENVERLEFLYHLSDGTTATAYAAAFDRDRILSIDVSVLVRSRKRIRGYRENPPFHSASGVNWTPAEADGFQRFLVVTNIKCRNMEFRDEIN